MVEFSLVSIAELTEAINQSKSLNDGPANFCKPVVPNDDVDLPDGACRAFYSGIAGAVRVRDPQGNVFSMEVSRCQYHPIRVQRVLATGTSATGIIALY